MVMSELPDPGSFGAAFVEFMRVMSLVAEERESEVAVRLREHLGTDPKGLPTTGAEFPLAEHPNLQLALDAVLGDAELVGFTTRVMGFGSIGMAEIVAGQGMAGPISLGPVRYVDVEVGDGRVVQCVESALLLAVHQEAPLALVLSRGGDQPMRPSSLRLEGVSPAPGAVSGLLRELRAAMRAHNVFRGRIISLHQDEHGGSVGVQFHTVPTVTRTDVIADCAGASRPVAAIGYSSCLACLRSCTYSSSRSKLSFQNRSNPPVHSWTGRSPRASRPYRRCLPALRSRTSPTSRSTRRCLDAPGWAIPSSWANSVTGRSPARSSTRISRRCGSAIALKTSDVVAARAMGAIICRYRHASSRRKQAGLVR